MTRKSGSRPSDIERTDQAEQLAFEGINGLDRQVIQDWAEQQEAEKSRAPREGNTSMSANGKKLHWTTAVLISNEFQSSESSVLGAGW